MDQVSEWLPDGMNLAIWEPLQNPFTAVAAILLGLAFIVGLFNIFLGFFRYSTASEDGHKRAAAGDKMKFGAIVAVVALAFSTIAGILIAFGDAVI